LRASLAARTPNGAVAAGAGGHRYRREETSRINSFPASSRA
jgi:hypothetical protein